MMRTPKFAVVVAILLAVGLFGVAVWSRSQPQRVSEQSAESSVPMPPPTPTAPSTPSPSPPQPSSPTTTPAPVPEPQGAPAPVPLRTWAEAPKPRPSTGRGPQPTRDGRPAELRIPSLAVRAPLVPAAIIDGVFQVPADPAAVGVHRGGAGSLPDRLATGQGTILASGHVTVGSARGALWPLHRLEPGAMLETSDGAGRTVRWRTTRLITVSADRLPADLLDTTGATRLVVVTCSGEIEQVGGRRRYRDNLIVEAVPER